MFVAGKKVAAVADAAVCPILTLDAGKWREHAADLDEPLHFIEIADPDEAPGGSGPGALGARGDTRPRHLAAGLACFSVTEAAPTRRISPGSRPDRATRRAHSAACPAPPLCTGYAASQLGRRLVCGWSRQPWRRARRQRFRPSLIGMPRWTMCYQR